MYVLKMFEDPRVNKKAANRGKTNNTMAKRKRTKGQTTIYKTLHRKQKIEQRKPIKTWGELMCSGSVSSSCSTNGTRCVTLLVISLLFDII
jgi:hypothetical protein